MTYENLTQEITRYLWRGALCKPLSQTYLFSPKLLCSWFLLDVYESSWRDQIQGRCWWCQIYLLSTNLLTKWWHSFCKLLITFFLRWVSLDTRMFNSFVMFNQFVMINSFRDVQFFRDVLFVRFISWSAIRDVDEYLLCESMAMCYWRWVLDYKVNLLDDIQIWTDTCMNYNNDEDKLMNYYQYTPWNCDCFMVGSVAWLKSIFNETRNSQDTNDFSVTS